MRILQKEEDGFVLGEDSSKKIKQQIQCFITEICLVCLSIIIYQRLTRIGVYFLRIMLYMDHRLGIPLLNALLILELKLS